MKRARVALLLFAFVGPVWAQDPVAPADPMDIVNSLLTGLLGVAEMTGPELQREVADLGGVPFRSDVPLDFMTRDQMAAYVKDMLNSEYPPAKASADERLLRGFGLLEPGVDLRALRTRLLLENVAGFYDERPGRKRLYAVSSDRRLTPSNQLVLAHELRHALQDQYADIHDQLPESVGDFDDRRMAQLSLLEGDATLLMERFLVKRLPGAGEALDLSGLSLPADAVPGAPPVLRDQLVLPYLLGRNFASAIWKKGGNEALKAAWLNPPDSTEQVLHPEKFLDREAPRAVEMGPPPAGGRLLLEGVLGEMLTRTLLGEGSDEAAAGWGGDRFRLWDCRGRTLLVWRAVWDTPGDAREFSAALLGRLRAESGPPAVRGGFSLFRGKGRLIAFRELEGTTEFLSSDDSEVLEAALVGFRAKP